MPSYCFWFGNPARTPTTFTEGVSVLSDKSVEQSPSIPERKPLSRRANHPRRPEQSSQTSNSIPTDVDFTLRSNNVQLSQTFIQIETRVHCWQSLCEDRQTNSLVLVIEGFQP